MISLNMQAIHLIIVPHHQISTLLIDLASIHNQFFFTTYTACNDAKPLFQAVLTGSPGRHLLFGQFLTH
jgi:hypothetical protein